MLFDCFVNAGKVFLIKYKVLVIINILYLFAVLIFQESVLSLFFLSGFIKEGISVFQVVFIRFCMASVSSERIMLLFTSVSVLADLYVFDPGGT